MADDPKQRVPTDLAAVNLREDWEVAYWCGKFDCTQSELQAAMQYTGSIISDDIAAYFENAAR
jgi:hypothetical protein